jgi:hypothetical protein
LIRCGLPFGGFGNLAPDALPLSGNFPVKSVLSAKVLKELQKINITLIIGR